MDKPLNFLYDHAGDVLYISQGHPVYTDSVALDENVILHLEPGTDHIVGFAIIDFTKRFVNSETPVSVPIAATFERVKQRKSQKTSTT